MNNRRAFTLAETLVTLAVIGVVMALMLRAINRVNPDKEKTLFLKSYHGIEAVIAEAINDPTYYDQSYYTDAQRAKFNANELHMDFRDDPLDNASVVIDGAEKKGIKKANAICYYLATGMNTIGKINCDSNPTNYNFKTTNGVCFSNWHGAPSGGYKDGTIKPTCDDKRTITVRVYRDGKISVPTTGGTLQKEAVEWIEKQTELN